MRSLASPGLIFSAASNFGRLPRFAHDRPALCRDYTMHWGKWVFAGRRWGWFALETSLPRSAARAILFLESSAAERTNSMPNLILVPFLELPASTIRIPSKTINKLPWRSTCMRVVVIFLPGYSFQYQTLVNEIVAALVVLLVTIHQSPGLNAGRGTGSISVIAAPPTPKGGVELVTLRMAL